MMKTYLILLLLIALVFVFLAGCTQLGGIGQPAPSDQNGGQAIGVNIKGFYPELTEVYSGDSTTFTITIENNGGEDATGVQAKIFGLGTDWKNIQPTGKTYIGGDAAGSTLTKAQPDLKIPGGTTDFQWTADAPANLPVDNTYTAGVRVYYGYKTTALGTLKIYSSNYLKERPELANQIMQEKGLVSFAVTNAPISVSFAGAERPLIYKSGSSSSATISIKISNLGQGYPYKTDETDRTITVDKIIVNEGGTGAKDCTPTAGQKLPRTGEKTISCTFTLPAVDEYTTIPISVELSYNYFVDGKTTITVLKNPS